MWFIGATSPVGNLLPTAVGIGRLAEWARAAGADTVLVDASGLLRGQVARVLAAHSYAAARGEVCVAVGDHPELLALSALLRTCGAEIVHTLSPGARERSAAERRAARNTMFARAFVGSRRREVDARRAGRGLGGWRRRGAQTRPWLPDFRTRAAPRSPACFAAAPCASTGPWRRRVTPPPRARWSSSARRRPARTSSVRSPNPSSPSPSTTTTRTSSRSPSRPGCRATRFCPASAAPPPNVFVAVDPTLARVGGDPREAGLVHRLDTDTSGVLGAARTQGAWDDLCRALSAGAVTKLANTSPCAGRCFGRAGLELPSLRVGHRVGVPAILSPTDKTR